jgi:hypothetical protein
MRPYCSLLAIFAIASIAASIVPVASIAQVASPAPSPSAPPSIPYRIPVDHSILPSSTLSPAKILYVFASGGDPATGQKLVARLARELQVNRSMLWEQLKYSNPKAALDLVVVMPEPYWGTSDYISACQSTYDLKPGQLGTTGLTAGAVIVYISSVASYTLSHFVVRTNHTEIDASLAYSMCSPTPLVSPTPTPPPDRVTVTAVHNVTRGSRRTTTTDYTVGKGSYDPPTPTPYYIPFQTQVFVADGKAPIVTPFPLIGIILSGISAWTALTPSVTKSTQNLTTFATPAPGSIMPPFGYVASSTTANQKVTNASQLTPVAAGFLGSSLQYEGSVTGIATADAQAINASGTIVGQFLTKLRCPYAEEAPATPSPNATVPACVNMLLGRMVFERQMNPDPTPAPGKTPIPGSWLTAPQL